MIVFDLQCHSSGHVFEGWFSSSQDFEDQRGKGMIVCPFCDDTNIGKAAMAPAVPRKGNQAPVQASHPANSEEANADPVPVATTGPLPPQARQALEKLAKMQAEALKSSEWVGKDFTEKARAMHYGESDKVAIHGEANLEQARDLMEEGIEVAPLIFPVVPPESRN